MTDEASHIERADIGEANISTLNVGDVQWGKIEELAALTTEIEKLREKDKNLLDALAAGAPPRGDQAKAESQERAKTTEIGSQLTEMAQISAIERPRESQEPPKRTNEEPIKPESSRIGARTASSQLIEVAAKAPEITIKAPDISIEVVGGANATSQPPAPLARPPTTTTEEKPKKTRKDRTIEIGEVQQLHPKAAPTASPEKAPAAPPVRQKAPGFYLGDDGRVRRPDGTFANKVEVRSFKNDAGDTGEQEVGKQHSLPALIVRAFGVLSTLGGKTSSGAGEQSGNVAGVATGGSIFLAAKEMSELAKDAKEAAKERGISGVSDIGPYLKKQLGFDADSRNKKQVDENVRRPPKQLKPGEQPRAADAQSKRLAGPSRSPAAKPPQVADAQSKRLAGPSRSPAAKPPQVADAQSKRLAGPGRSPAPLPAERQQKAAGGPSAPASSGHRSSTSSPSRKVAPAELPKSAVASQQDKLATQQKAATDSQLKQSEEQHDEVIKTLGELIDAVKPKGPGMLDSAFDMAGDMWDRRGNGRKGRKRRQRTRLTGDQLGRRSRGEPRGRRTPSRPGRADMPQRQPRMARVRAGMGKGLAALPAVSAAAGRSAGAIAKSGVAMGGAAMGRMAGVGARAIPLVGQAIALGLAANDAYDGYNDKERQAKTFGLKNGKEATTGQKSAMAAARALDLGGLTSGAAGLLGSAAGAMGMKKLEEALTFDSDDMAKAIYEGMTLFTRKNPKERAQSGDTTINNMGGITPRGVTGETGDWKGTPLKFDGVEAESGLPSGYLAATAAVESGGNWNAVNKQSGAMGGWQFMPKTAAGLGLSAQDAFDPSKSTKAMIEHTKQNQAYFEKTMGRAPEGRELYLMHQQGMGGGTKLLKNPNALASDVLNSKSVNGMKAVLQNGGRADMTAKEFADMVLAKYDKAEAYNKANPGKAIDMDKLVGAKPKYEAPMMLRGGPKPGEVAPALAPPAPSTPPVSAGQPGDHGQFGQPSPFGQLDRPGNVVTPPAAMQAKSGPPAALMPPRAATETVSPVAVSKALPPAAIRPVSDIQSITIRNELAEKGKDKKPYAPGANADAAMLTVLKSMDRSLKELNKDGQAKTPSGGPARSGGKPSVSGHPAMNGPMASFANDQR